MLKNDYIDIKIGGSNVTYFRSLGFKCNMKDVITVHYSLVSSKSKVKVIAICDYCGKEREIPLCDYLKQYEGIIKKYCCKDCKGVKTKESNMIIYGVESVAQLDSTKNKCKETMLERYGVEHALQSKQFMDKFNETVKNKYGVDNVNELQEIKDKIKSTNIAKYGTEYYTQTKEYKDRVSDTNMHKYGVANVFQNKSIQEKQKSTINKIYGVDNVFQNESIKDKIKNVVKDRYGVEHIMHLEKYKNKVIKSGLKTKYIHNSQSCSTQQRYIHSLIGGELNYPIDNISLDIALPNEKVYIEYNGSGHDLDVKLGKISERDFKYKEIRRYKYLKSLGWKQIEINSPKDLLPDDNTIIHLINNAITNILNNNCNHITININENTFDNLRKIKSSTINLN